MPELLPIVAVEVLLLTHVPPVIEFVKEVIYPTHTVGVPVIIVGKGLIVTLYVRKHPVANA